MAWQQAITWANADPDLCHYMVSLGHNELSLRDFLNFYSKYSVHKNAFEATKTAAILFRPQYVNISRVRVTKAPFVNSWRLIILPDLDSIGD